MAGKQNYSNDATDANRDPLSGEPGAHPVGTGVGAAGGGAAGAAIGSAVGPIGTAVGAVVGAVAGGLTGKGVAEAVDPTAEDAYWRENYKTRGYIERGKDYSYYAPAYRYGWESRQRYSGQQFDQVEPQLRKDWAAQGKTGLAWDQAKLAVKDAWDRIGHASGSRTGAAEL